MDRQGQEETGAPQFARAPQPMVELRGDAPRQTVDVLDAVSMARDISRTQLVNEVLGEWAAKKLHEAMLVHRVAAVHPPHGDAVGGNRA